MFVYPQIDMVKTGERIAQLRIQNGYSVKDIQECMGFTSPMAVYKWQRGVSLPSLDNLVILAQLFGVSMEEVLVISRPVQAQAKEELRIASEGSDAEFYFFVFLMGKKIICLLVNYQYGSRVRLDGF